MKKSSGTLYWRAYWADALARLGGLAETDLSGNTTSEYVFFAGRRIARRDSSGNVYYYFADQLGRTRVITNSTGTTCFDADSYPGVYPERSRRSGEMDHTNTCPQNYKFTGYERDPEAGLDYAFFRYYNSRLGRFMSPDPLGGSVSNPQSLNRYAYVLNNPANAIDPAGLACKDPFDPICIADTDPGGGGGWIADPLICSAASSNCDPFGLLGWVSPTIGGFRAGDGGFFGGGPQCTIDNGFAACSMVQGLIDNNAAWTCPNNDCTGLEDRQGQVGQLEVVPIGKVCTAIISSGKDLGCDTVFQVQFVPLNGSGQGNSPWPSIAGIGGSRLLGTADGAAQFGKYATRPPIKVTPPPSVFPRNEPPPEITNTWWARFLKQLADLGVELGVRMADPFIIVDPCSLYPPAPSCGSVPIT